MDQDLSVVPTKCISNIENLEIRARVTYIDYEGRSDGDSIKKIINQMKPRQLVIVHGPPEASLDLAESCKAFSKDIKVYTPKLQETVDATSETHIYQVRLKDSLVSSLQFCKAKDTELAWIDGVLDMRVVKVDTGVMLEEGMKEEVEDGDLAMDITPDLGIEHSATTVAAQRAMKNLFGEDEKEFSEESDVIPTLEPLPPHEIPGHQSVFINEPRLSDFKQVLLREGIQAEFVGGVLVCNNMVAVRRAHMNIQPHLCRAPVRCNGSIRKSGDKNWHSEWKRRQGVIAGVMCPLQPWWHIDSTHRGERRETRGNNQKDPEVQTSSSGNPDESRWTWTGSRTTAVDVRSAAIHLVLQKAKEAMWTNGKLPGRLPGLTVEELKSLVEGGWRLQGGREGSWEAQFSPPSLSLSLSLYHVHAAVLHRGGIHVGKEGGEEEEEEAPERERGRRRDLLAEFNN
ncbi:hypothetical protein INR49_028659 [Caranx melampygus]|nr:hypothetical protein INR49_028659 [Caranx melampygus]